jgi:hypothetical protein
MGVIKIMGTCESCFQEIDVHYYLCGDEICESCYLKIVGFYGEDDDDEDYEDDEYEDIFD